MAHNVHLLQRVADLLRVDGAAFVLVEFVEEVLDLFLRVFLLAHREDCREPLVAWVVANANSHRTRSSVTAICLPPKQTYLLPRLAVTDRRGIYCTTHHTQSRCVFNACSRMKRSASAIAAVVAYPGTAMRMVGVLFRTAVRCVSLPQHTANEMRHAGLHPSNLHSSSLLHLKCTARDLTSRTGGVSMSLGSSRKVRG